MADYGGMITTFTACRFAPYRTCRVLPAGRGCIRVAVLQQFTLRTTFVALRVRGAAFPILHGGMGCYLRCWRYDATVAVW